MWGQRVTLAAENRTAVPDLTPTVRNVLHRTAREQRRPVDLWERRYLRALVLVDFIVILDSTLLPLHTRVGDADQSVSGVSYAVLSVLLVPAWLAALAVARAYEMRFLGTGADEFKRVSSASLRLMAVVAVIAYTFQIQVARGYVAI